MSIGAGLARARQDAGLTLDEVSEGTRVRKALLEALERDDFDACGGDVYARGHIRTYCDVVGTDPAPFLAEFDTARSGARASAPTMTKAFESERRAATDVRRTGPNWSAAMAATLAVVVVLGVVGLLTRGDGPAAPPIAVGTSSTAVTSSSPPPPSSPTPTPSTTPSAVPTASSSPTVVAQRPVAGVKVVVKVTAPSWVSASNGRNGTTFYEGILRAGQSRTFTDPKKVRLVIGNAGGVLLTVNGRDLGAPGSSGQVTTVEFGPGDPTSGQG